MVNEKEVSPSSEAVPGRTKPIKFLFKKVCGCLLVICGGQSFRVLSYTTNQLSQRPTSVNCMSERGAFELEINDDDEIIFENE